MTAPRTCRACGAPLAGNVRWCLRCYEPARELTPRASVWEPGTFVDAPIVRGLRLLTGAVAGNPPALSTPTPPNKALQTTVRRSRRAPVHVLWPYTKGSFGRPGTSASFVPGRVGSTVLGTPDEHIVWFASYDEFMNDIDRIIEARGKEQSARSKRAARSLSVLWSLVSRRGSSSRWRGTGVSEAQVRDADLLPPGSQAFWIAGRIHGPRRQQVVAEPGSLPGAGQGQG